MDAQPPDGSGGSGPPHIWQDDGYEEQGTNLSQTHDVPASRATIPGVPSTSTCDTPGPLDNRPGLEDPTTNRNNPINAPTRPVHQSWRAALRALVSPESEKLGSWRCFLQGVASGVEPRKHPPQLHRTRGPGVARITSGNSPNETNTTLQPGPLTPPSGAALTQLNNLSLAPSNTTPDGSALPPITQSPSTQRIDPPNWESIVRAHAEAVASGMGMTTNFRSRKALNIHHLLCESIHRDVGNQAGEASPINSHLSDVWTAGLEEMGVIVIRRSVGSVASLDQSTINARLEALVQVQEPSPQAQHQEAENIAPAGGTETINPTTGSPLVSESALAVSGDKSYRSIGDESDASDMEEGNSLVCQCCKRREAKVTFESCNHSLCVSCTLRIWWDKIDGAHQWPTTISCTFCHAEISQVSCAGERSDLLYFVVQKSFKAMLKLRFEEILMIESANLRRYLRSMRHYFKHTPRWL